MLINPPFLIAPAIILALAFIFRDFLRGRVESLLREEKGSGYYLGLRAILALSVAAELYALFKFELPPTDPLPLIGRMAFLTEPAFFPAYRLAFAILILLSGYLFTRGIALRLSAPVFFALSLILGTAVGSYGSLTHGFQLTVLILSVYAFAALILRGQEDVNASAFALSLFVVGAMYFGSFLSKFSDGGSIYGWLGGESLRNAIWTRHITAISANGSHDFNWLQRLVISNQLAAALLSSAVVILEFLSPLVFLGGKTTRRVFLVSLIIFHFFGAYLVVITPFYRNSVILLYLAYGWLRLPARFIIGKS